MNHANISAHEGGTKIKLLREKWDVVKALTKAMATEAITQFEKGGAFRETT